MNKYTREAGVRTLERRIGAVCRAVAVRVAEKRLQRRREPGAGAADTGESGKLQTEW